MTESRDASYQAGFLESWAPTTPAMSALELNALVSEDQDDAG